MEFPVAVNNTQNFNRETRNKASVPASQPDRMRHLLVEHNSRSRPALVEERLLLDNHPLEAHLSASSRSPSTHQELCSRVYGYAASNLRREFELELAIKPSRQFGGRLPSSLHKPSGLIADILEGVDDGDYGSDEQWVAQFTSEHHYACGHHQQQAVLSAAQDPSLLNERYRLGWSNPV